MLKIKDDVDLKELEKFGFHKNVIEHHPEFTKYYLDCRTQQLVIFGEDYPKREKGAKAEYIFPRRIRTQSASTKDIDVLYDLIQAGLVEKV